MTYLNEDILAQQTTSDYVHDYLCWDWVYGETECPQYF